MFYFKTQDKETITLLQDKGYTGTDPCKKDEELFKE